jgi:hypothetical protein
MCVAVVGSSGGATKIHCFPVVFAATSACITKAEWVLGVYAVGGFALEAVLCLCRWLGVR